MLMRDGEEWLRARGIGRERFAGYVTDFLSSIGYRVERIEAGEPVATQILARLDRINPAVPESARELRLRIDPTSGGGALFWVSPREVPEADRGRLDRLARELALQVERTVLTGSHGTAKVIKAPESRLPWQSHHNGSTQPL